MANTLMKLLVALGIDSSDLDSGLKDGENKAKSSASNIGKTMLGIGTGLTAGLTLPIAAAGVKAVGLASDLEQSIGGVESVFGDAGQTIFDFGETAAEAVGLSKESFNSLSTVSGALLQNLGFDSEGAANEMVNLAERGADVAATFGGPVAGVLEAVNSALKGEFNPLEQFGVKMNQAAINAEALRLGLVGTTQDAIKVRDAQLKATDAQDAYNESLIKYGDESPEAAKAGLAHAKAQKNLEESLAGTMDEITDSAKAQAALSLFYEQTASTTGQFASESDTLAGQQERLKAKFENTAASLGTQLLPIGLKIMQFVSDLVDKFSALNPEQQKTILIIAGIAAAIGPLVTIIGGLITAFGAIAGVITGPVVIAIAAIIALVVLLKTAWEKNWGGIQEKTQKVVNFIKMIISTFQSALAGDWELFGQKLRALWNIAWGEIKAATASLMGWLGNAFDKGIDNIVNFFKNVDWANLGRNIILGIGNGIAAMSGWLADKAAAAAGAALAAAKGFLGIHSESKEFGKLGKFSAMGFGLQFQKSMAGFQPQMAMSMSVPAANVATPAGNGISADDLRGAQGEKIDYVKFARIIRDTVLKGAQ